MSDSIRQADERNDQAIACLSLNIGKVKSSPAGNDPSDADLSALIEGRLDDVRRAQVISHIANNKTIYSRWLRLIEDMAYLGEITPDVIAEEIATSAGTAKSTTLSEKLRNFFTPKTVGIFGGGFAAATIALLVILALPLNQVINISQGIDDAYIDWGSALSAEWANTPESQKPKPITKPKYSSSRKFTFKPVIKSDIRKIIETGFRDGSTKIKDYPFDSYRVDPASLSNITPDQVAGISADDYSLFYNTGRLAAIASMQCVIAPTSQRLEDLYKVASVLVNGLKNTQAAEINPIVENFDTTRDQSSAVCQLSGKIMDYLVAKP